MKLQWHMKVYIYIYTISIHMPSVYTYKKTSDRLNSYIYIWVLGIYIYLFIIYIDTYHYLSLLYMILHMFIFMGLDLKDQLPVPQAVDQPTSDGLQLGEMWHESVVVWTVHDDILETVFYFYMLQFSSHYLSKTVQHSCRYTKVLRATRSPGKWRLQALRSFCFQSAPGVRPKVARVPVIHPKP